MATEHSIAVPAPRVLPEVRPRRKAQPRYMIISDLETQYCRNWITTIWAVAGCVCRGQMPEVTPIEHAT